MHSGTIAAWPLPYSRYTSLRGEKAQRPAGEQVHGKWVLAVREG